MQEQWDIIITPNSTNKKWTRAEWKQIVELCSLFVKRNIITQYKQAMLGPLWLVLLSLVTTVVYPLSTITQPLIKRIMLLNPLTPVFERIKYSLFSTGEISLNTIIYAVMNISIILFLAALIFNKVQRNAMDIV